MAGAEELPPPVWESYRTLRASLAGADARGGFPSSILVTGASPAEGKTLTSVNLAITLAQAGVRVVLVDADLRRPTVAAYFRIAVSRNTVGNVLMGRVSPADAIVPAPGYERLGLLLAGHGQGHPDELLQRSRIDTLLKQLSAHADVVVIDSAPLGEVADALAVADAVETVLVCVRLGHTRGKTN